MDSTSALTSSYVLGWMSSCDSSCLMYSRTLAPLVSRFAARINAKGFVADSRLIPACLVGSWMRSST
eukprot:11873852-Prorocentrum_lima.AAC.1